MSKDRDRVTVAEVMTTRVRTATPDRSIREIWKILVDEECHHLPIIDDGRVVGVVSTTDLVALVRKNESRPLPGSLLDDTRAAEVMTTEVEKILSDEWVDVAIDRIGPGAYHALLVVDESDALVGIVTHHDLLYYLAS